MSRLVSSDGTVSRRNYLKAATTAVAALVGVGATGTAAASDTEATITFNNQPVENGEVTIESTEMADGGFVTIHNTSLLDGVGAGSIIGISEYLEPGTHEEVCAELFVDPLETEADRLKENQILIAVPHLDTNGNEEFDFLPSNPDPDVAYTNGPQAIGGLPNDGVNDIAWVTVE